MKFGILACGPMAETFADTLRQLEEAECYAVASRTLERAEKFAEKFGFQKAYGSYEELCEDRKWSWSMSRHRMRSITKTWSCAFGIKSRCCVKRRLP